MKFSVLIPAFNAEAFIEKCIKSLLQQSYKNFEVIIVDDGSYDNTLQICKYYSSIDNRISIYFQANAGTAVTRNKLLSLAQGEWIVFVDADDYIAKNYLETFYNHINSEKNTDLFICNYYILSEEKRKGLKNKFDSINDFTSKLLGWRVISTALWGKAIRKSILNDNNIVFENGINIGEDLLFLAKLSFHIKDICSIPDYLYFWERSNTASITAKPSTQKWLDTIQLYTLLTNLYKESDVYSSYLSSTKIRVKREMLLSKNNDIIQLSNSSFTDLQLADYSNYADKIIYILVKMKLVLLLKITKKIEEKRLNKR